MKDRAIALRRMYSQHLWGPPLRAPEDVVGSLAAMQSQEFPAAKWSVAQRSSGVTDADMDLAFAEGRILRTHVLRPTWHFVLPADIRWLQALTAPRVDALSAHYYRRNRLDDELFARSNAVLAAAVQGGHRTRTELAEALEQAGIDASGLRLGLILLRAELDAVICSGAPRGKQQTYASVEERAPDATTLSRDEALAELTRRYFTTRGPATVKDHSWWSSLTIAEGKRGLDMVGAELESEVVDGRTHWFAASSPPITDRPTKVVDLVQTYDERIVSYRDSRDVPLGGLSPGSDPFTAVVLLDGQMIGHWRRVRQKDSVAVETFLHRPLARTEENALDAAVERLGRFVGLPARPVVVG